MQNDIGTGQFGSVLFENVGWAQGSPMGQTWNFCHHWCLNATCYKCIDLTRAGNSKNQLLHSYENLAICRTDMSPEMRSKEYTQKSISGV